MMEVASGEHGSEIIQKLIGTVQEDKNESSVRIVVQDSSTNFGELTQEISESDFAIASKLQHHSTINELPSLSAGGYSTSKWTQFRILLIRTFRTMYRDRQLTQMRLLAHFIVGAIIGMIYYGIGNDGNQVKSNSGCLFFTILFTLFSAMMPTILTFPVEMSVFIKEHMNCRYSLKTYYLAKTVSDLPIQMTLTTSYFAVVYVLSAQPLESDRMGMFILICVLTSLVSQSIGLLIGALFSIETGVFLGPVSTIPSMLFSGFFVNFSAMPEYIQWLSYTSYVRYAFEGVMICIYGLSRENLKCIEENCLHQNPKTVL